MSITVYTKPNCGQCDATKRRLDKNVLDYRTIDITQDDAARHFVTCELGYLQAPVVVVDGGEHWSGFRIDALDKLAAA
ncbi:glutaredoxin domain-containing protein [Rhodococcus ruber]|uniref:Glutaredoxin domain-containing protein n=1 Tax=Rhodococcus ruber TaxID=1830 RepID=A0ABT4M7T5_9NOCA|nr:glutaredoxin domain-containing protein [Rhodococcus ruber]MCZ4516933.1 glutaredoxin domain-containing protein [Rhodococcus ruber]